MFLLRSKIGIAISVMLVGSMQSFLYFLHSYPNVLRDLVINQQLGYIGSGTSYFRYSQSGSEEMKKSTATFVGVGKSADKTLVKNLLMDLEKLSQEFSSSRAIFVIDSTALSMQQLFNAWAKESSTNRTILIATAPNFEEEGLFPGSESTIFSREGKISQARNVALEEYKAGTATDYIINLDLDIIGWDAAGVRDSFGQTSEWDVACANGVILHGIYRDAYALRAPGIETNHHLSGLDHGRFNISAADKVKNREILVQSKRKIQQFMDGRSWNLNNSLQSSSDLVRLDSCFGGMAIYKTSVLQDCVYSHRRTAGPPVVDCEHVLYHQCLTEKHQARVVSNRNMKIWYGHTSLVSLDYAKFFRSLFNL